MFISKHHYALELARMGNTVYFMNSPDKTGTLRPGEVRIDPVGEDKLYVIKHKLFYPYILKHRVPFFHKLLLKYHIRNIFKKIGKPVDIVWSFDYSDTIHLDSFPDHCFKIFMPVDNPTNPTQEKRGDVIFSVTQEILDMYHCDTPKMFVNHGVAEHFINDSIITHPNNKVQVGLSGNFLRTDIDWHCLLDIVQHHRDIVFNFWGPFDLKGANLSAETSPLIGQYKRQLSNIENVVLHGAVDSFVLAAGLRKMDCFLICYDVEKDHSKGTNYHKVLEYLAAGKVIVSNNITTYHNTGLVEMPAERHNDQLPALFTEVVNNLAKYNAREAQLKRVEYAKAHTYKNNIRSMEAFITQRVLR